MKNKRKKSILLALTIICILLFMTGASMGYLFYLKSTGRFISRTTLNGYDVSGQNPQQVFEIMDQRFSNTRVILTENQQCAFDLTLAELGFRLEKESTMSLIQQALSVQNQSVFQLAKSALFGRKIRMDLPSVVDETVFAAQVSADRLLVPRILNQDASLIQDENGTYSIKAESKGTEFQDPDLQYEVRSQINLLIGNASEKSEMVPPSQIDLAFPQEIYLEPLLRADSTDLNFLCDVYNQYSRNTITYQFGSQSETLAWDTIKDWIQVNGTNVSFDREGIQSYVRDLAERYNTRYLQRTFMTTYGYEVSFPGNRNEYGYIIDEAAECEQLLKDLSSNTSVNREPVYIQTNSYGNPLYYQRNGKDDLAGTYVEISISAQHLWFYKNGNLIVESDLVSGCVANGTPTQTGVFPLAYKKSPDILVGSNANDGYQTQVQYWMPFYEGQGLHDATWRGYFGGTIYQYDGSHGCVNLPYDKAGQIYANIEPGMAIIIYQ